ncbi:MAG: hypothetical protein V1735_08145 [Nanoarchaeota archaeon]
MRTLVTCFLMLLLAVSGAVAATEVVLSNSRDWTDVYSVEIFGFLQGTTPMFLVSERHGTIILTRTLKETPVRVYSSKNPFVIGMRGTLVGQGFLNITEETPDNINLALGRRTNVTRFIITDPTYGYNAIALGSYAVLTRSWIIFADRNNLNTVLDFLGERKVDSILVYGQVDREVREALTSYPLEIINEAGDRFANNVEIVKRYKALADSRQVLMSNGEFIEGDLIGGGYPVLFIGKQNVPDKIAEYVRNSNIEVGVLIGNDLVSTATFVRRQLGISTFVKFARSGRNPTGPINEVEGLDVFYVPVLQLGIGIDSIVYNKVTSQLQVNLRNFVGVPTYFKGTYTVQDGQNTQVVGDLDPLFIDKGANKTVTYAMSPLSSDEVTAKAFVIFGESKGALELILSQAFNVSVVAVTDESDIIIEKVVFDKNKNRFDVVIKNVGSVDSYVRTELVDFLVDGIPRSYASPSTLHLRPGERGRSFIPAELTDADRDANPLVAVRAYYGKDPGALFKILDWKGQISVKSFDLWTWLPLIIILLLIILIILARRRKKKKHGQNGGHGPAHQHAHGHHAPAAEAGHHAAPGHKEDSAGTKT